MSHQFWLRYLFQNITHQIEDYAPGQLFFDPDGGELLRWYPNWHEILEIEAIRNGRIVRHRFTPAVTVVIRHDWRAKDQNTATRFYSVQECECAWLIEYFNRWSRYGPDSLDDFAWLLDRGLFRVTASNFLNALWFCYDRTRWKRRWVTVRRAVVAPLQR